MIENAKGKIFSKQGGCTEDCLNCPYPDCYKPAARIKSDGYTKLALHSDSFVTESQAKMYTLELGGVGKDMPNLSRKFYL